MFRGDLQRLCDVGVRDLAVRGAGGQAGEGEQADLALQLLVVELLLLNPALVLVIEVVVVLKVLLGEDLEKLRVDGVRVAERLYGREDAQILEVETGGRQEGDAEGLEGELLGFL
jgi:hypothetical protein